MKILQVITSMRIGGAEKLVAEMAPRMQNAGHQVDVLLFDGTNTPLKEQLEKEGINVYHLAIGKSVYHPLFIFQLIAYLKKYDIIHTHNTACQLFVAIASLFCSATIITTEHNTSNRRRNWSWYRFIDRWMYNQYQHIVCISDAAEKNLKVYIKHCQTSTTTIYNGINLSRFITAQPNHTLAQQKNGRYIITMVAGFREQKDQDTLIRSLRYLPQSKYEIWLVGDGKRKEALQELCKKEQVIDYVRFLGIRNDIPEILKTSDIIVMSSHYEGLSLSSIEGMASGKPFIASDVDGLHEITEGSGILFPHENEKELAEKIQTLMENKNLYYETSELCMKKAALYDIQHTTNNYLRTYQQKKHD